MATMPVADFYGRATFKDVTVKYDGREFAVHRLVCSMNNGFFSRAVEDEAVEVIKLDEDGNGDVVEAVLRHLYTLPYIADTGSRQTDLQFHVKVAEMADRYELPSLNDIAQTKVIQSMPNSLIQTLAQQIDIAVEMHQHGHCLAKAKKAAVARFSDKVAKYSHYKAVAGILDSLHDVRYLDAAVAQTERAYYKKHRLNLLRLPKYALEIAEQPRLAAAYIMQFARALAGVESGRYSHFHQEELRLYRQEPVALQEDPDGGEPAQASSDSNRKRPIESTVAQGKKVKREA
ncbi:hypothetical protein LTS10_011040 [Elasticomyces elasticus]|nr:hypothetical protein LTS10_011040 [Elasticomyces elasticus]